MRRLLTWLLPYIARIYAHYGLALGELDHERLRAELIADVRAQLHDAMAAVNGGLPDRGVSTIATNRPNGGIPGATPNAPAPGAGPGTPTDKVVTTNAAGAHDSTVRTHARIGLAPGAHVLAFVLISLFAVALHAAPEPDPLNVIRHAFALPQGGAANSNGRFDSNGNLYVNVAAGGGAGGTSSSFAAAFPATGTAIGAKNGANMVNLVADGSGNLDVNCTVGCAGGSFNNNADAVATSATNGQTAAWLYGFNGATFDRLQVDASKYLKVNCATGCSGGATTPTDAFANPTTAGLSFSFLAGWNGTTWDRLQVDGSKNLLVAVHAALPAGTNVIGHVIVDTAPTTAVTGTFWQATQPVSGTFWQATQPVSGTFWQATQPVSLASAQVASGAYASGSISDGADVTLGAKADAKSAATDTTAITVMQVLKEISSLEQAPASRAVTNAGTFGVQATIADAADTTLGAKADAKSTATDTTAVTIMQVLKEISAQEQAPASRAVTNAGTFAVQPSSSGNTGSAVPTAGSYGGGNGSGNLTGDINCDSQVVYDTNTNGKTQLVALASSKIVYVCGIQLSQSTTSAVTVSLGSGTGTNCGSTYTAKTPAWPLQSATSVGPIGLVLPQAKTPWFKTAASEELCISTNAAVSVQALVSYTQF